LKKGILKALILCLPDLEKPFMVIIDTLDFIVKEVISQDQGFKLQLIAFTSRKINLVERNYMMHKKEILMIIHAVKK
jgi:hypothetical protein